MNDRRGASAGLRRSGRALLHRAPQIAYSLIGTRTLAVLCLIATCAGIFIGLADEVDEGETRAFDTAVLLAFRSATDPSDPLGPGWVEEIGRDFTALGGVAVLTFLTLAVAGFLWLQSNRRSALFLLACVTSGLLVSSVFKWSFDRPRPELVPHDSIVYTTSFPSGHSMMAAVTYLTLGVMLARIQPRRRVKLYILALAVLLTVAVGISRVYLGVHWPTDVLAGWSAGAAWALLCWLLARLLQRQGAVEPEAGSAADPHAQE